MHPSIDSTLAQWLSYIESIHPVEIELGLQRLQTVAHKLGLGHKSAVVFTVAGTNGKGTTTAVLSALAQAAGKSVGWYTSPHLLQFNERIRINSQPISDQELVCAFNEIEKIRGDITLSYFEYTSLAAFYLFQQQSLDVWVLEVGLGGRLDAVNIIEPDVAVVTNIGLDHQGFLGDTVDEIAKEKAGIARSGKPLVLGSVDIPSSLFDVCESIGAPVYRFGANHVSQDNVLRWQARTVVNTNLTIPNANAVTAIQAFELAGFSMENIDVAAVLAKIEVAGRLQRVLHKGQPIVLDVGHNPHAGRYICEQLDGQRFHVLLGMLSDKDALGFVGAVKSITKSLNFVDLAVPRGLSAAEMALKIGKTESKQFGAVGEFIENMVLAFPGEPLFIGGSFYTVCHALKYLENNGGS